jgi:hypothetical protein
MPKRKNEEHEIQAGIIKLASFLPECRWLHAIPNGGNRSLITGIMLKAEGVKAGVLDLFLPYVTADFHGLYIEVKRPGGAMSVKQQEFASYAMLQGYRVVCVDSIKDGFDAILEYLGKPRAGYMM